uniref:Molybdenum carrier n=1 Tax=Candidatus Kentrum sp. FM TaxID=2126340 RepID=A0A450VWN6_9GAMM|nr:MAG: Putative molybdenum carrier [Candidatus Kentron sp. FM]VFJ76547.1 MAG: Putative molybdenum carrier [Candidatus Kentron sp. FM]VFK09199.1 MAG: Putative molybdenum carrier [Candidatus Kentron sp. FM]
MSLEKIISGGQTGVDQAALRAASVAGLAIGGWCPPNRECESGTIPSAFPLVPTDKERSELAPDIPRSLRTQWNVRDSDATCIIIPGPDLFSRHGTGFRYPGRNGLDNGTRWTAICAQLFHKPLLIVDPDDDGTSDEITSWVQHLDIRTLNIAGPSERAVPGIGEQAFEIMSRILRGDSHHGV